MNFTLITADEFRAYADRSPYKSFMQTPEIAKYREKNGWTPYYFAVVEDGQIKAATMAVARPTFLGKSTFFAPGGPLVDYEDTTTLEFLVKNLKNYCKSHNGYVLQIDPYYTIQEYSRHGEPLPGQPRHANAVKNLQNLGFFTFKSTQPRYLFALNLEKQTPAQLFDQFKSNTRNHIRKAEKMGVHVRELSRAELPVLKEITKSTSERRGFTDRPLAYYEEMYDLFTPRGEVKFLVAEIDGASENVHSRASATNEEQKERPSPVTTGARECTENGSFLTPLPLSAAMFMTYGDEVVYLFSGSDEKYMKDYNAQYAIQWHMIKYAAEHGFRRYNFYGIHALPTASTTDGIYDFKKGFTSEANGRVIELLGSYELPLSPLFYRLHHLLKNLKHH